MKYKKVFAVILVGLAFIEALFATVAFATEQKDMTAYEFANALQQFASDNSSNIIDSILPEPMNRLIVKTYSNTPLSNTYGAIDTLEGFDGLHILQYETEEETETAFCAFQNENIKYVEYDYWIDVDVESPKICNCENNEQKYDFCACSGTTGFCDCPDNTSENHLSWNSTAVNVDQAFELINNSKIQCEPVTVAILDTGLCVEHEYFDSNRIVLDKDYCLVIDGVEYPSSVDFHYHGTHVAGTVYDNTMSNVNIVPYRIFGKSVKKLPYSVLNGALKAIISNDDFEIDVISMSIGKEPYDSESENLLLYETLNEAIDKNIIIVVAAGNDSDDSNNYIPASFNDAIVVSATKKGGIADTSYSNYGSGVDIGAPGTDIYSTTPVVAGKHDEEDNEFYISYMRTSGTSMATPLVAAAAATLKSIIPDITPSQAERLIKETAYVPDGWDFNYGAGIVDFYNMVKTALRTQTEIKLNSNDKFEIISAGCIDSVYYTLDGTEPTPENGLVYSLPLDLSNRTVPFIKAASYRNGEKIGETAVYKMFRYETVKIDYKETKHIYFSNYTKKIRWQSSDPNIATVDSEGNIKGVGIGETDVTAKLRSGKRIVYNVKVEYSLLQRFIMVFLFGFLWY